MRLLLVEDDKALGETLRLALQRAGYVVDWTGDARAAVAGALSQEYAAVLLDLSLGGLDGGSALRALRAARNDTPVIIMTALDDRLRKLRELDAGADDYLVKPFEIRELLARLRALTRRSSEQPKTTLLQVVDLVLDNATHHVERGGKTIELTAKEYAVLECLMREPGRVLTRTMIAEHVWNYDVYNESNVVNVYIRNLRRKIDDGCDLKLIQTVHGVGYRLSVEEDETV